ncbi:hypothetical protein AUK04_01190 [Candidatus Roizmanbacteria bacterium CG2_30_33_16]|uniref:Uncharacterized protein n=3 Tax=Candidatus Roizmaniibacteriota TaxID=1752723 RepID=A0A2M7E5B4_9BACT|nr:hypothetical protein [Candidatus Roizmanbacteria bacterium]OIP85366.1 MAG: hypothetical protein AUK04_01190 [Candidatus Roizmanbacteria bacterium CG2_30_33_16]PIV62905.1 MAG: hypothetical protein COS12_00615 [Candidatus Roizmanbacteria bacterium CG01_land_8_20_14_3_00_33_9]PIX70128.1 MAG: hypothetical protein COZ39_04835 [Candidatus Roizmanbacteria bacterium CG_4_10_14_3_um_filter_33_21]
MHKKTLIKKLFVTVVAAGFFAVFIWVTPPDIWWKILIVIALLLLIVYLISSLFLPRKFVRLLTVFLLIFFTLNATIGFNLINALLLASLLITLATVIK